MGAYCRHGVIAEKPCGYCKQDLAKDARIAALEAALAKAEEALGKLRKGLGYLPYPDGYPALTGAIDEYVHIADAALAAAKSTTAGEGK